MKAFQALIIVY